MIIGDVCKLPFRNKVIAVVVACEIIEHLRKNICVPFLNSLDNISRGSVIISTPNYKYIQGDILGNPHEEHVSFYNTSTFRQISNEYQIKGIGFQLNGIWIPRTLPILGKVFENIILVGLLSIFSELIVIVKRIRTRSEEKEKWDPRKGLCARRVDKEL